MRVPKSEARRNFSDVVGRAGRRGERVKITHYGRTLAVLIPTRDLHKLEDCEDGAGAASEPAGKRPAGSGPARGKSSRRKTG